MCGIIGRVGNGDAVETIVRGLENLEYRGYDSAGIAVQNGHGLDVRKRSGSVDELQAALDGTLAGAVGIGHTRWSTHGPPTRANAHPHTDDAGEVAVVHNGIIENHDELRSKLEAAGHTFSSETDTEVIPHLIRRYLATGYDMASAFRRTVRDLEGSYAVAAVRAGEHVLHAARDGSPLVVGLDDGDAYVASDVPAFLEFTDRVIFLEDGDVAVLDAGEVEITDTTGRPVDRPPRTVGWDPEQAGKAGFEHFMLKEINEQPTALAQALEGRVHPEGGRVSLEGIAEGAFADLERVVLIGCGTSYHAALYTAILLRRAGVRATATLANEFELAGAPVDGDTLAVAVTQSGETADTIAALRAAQADGAATLTVTNVVGSTAERLAEESLLIRAGPEIGVAATKTFSSQVVVLAILANRIAAELVPTGQPGAVLEELPAMPDALADLLDRSNAEQVAQAYHESRSYFFIGRGLGVPVALEAALKFKEITYEHAEGFAAGELKHGPLALVTEETPVFAIFTGRADERTLANAEEAGTRGSPIVAVCPDGHPAVDVADRHLLVPDVHPDLAGLFANVQLQLLSYHAAAMLQRPIDKPRNLAKSVTVQ